MENQKYKWDFKEFFKSDEEFLKSLENFKKQIEIVEKDLKDLSLEDKLIKFYELSLMGEKLVTYSELNSDLDISNEKYLSYKTQAYMEKGKLDSINNHINEEILKIDVSLEEYMKNHPYVKRFYMHFYNVLRTKEHTISSNVITNENVLISRINDLYNTIMNVEISCEEVEINEEETKVNRAIYNKYINNQDRNLREKVFKAFMNSLKNVNKSISSLFGIRYQICFDIAKEKGYKSILEQVITEEDLNMKIIDNLINSVHENLHVLNRYLDLKRKKLKLEELHFYDLNVNTDYNPKYTFSEGLQIVKKSLKVMGKSYEKALEKVLEGGMLDVFPNKYKFGGGYHFRNYTKPMILMNYRENFREVPTIAHELGHAINGIFIKENQEFQNFHFSIFLSEIASTVNEDRVEKYFYENANDKEKQIHLEKIIDKTITAIFFQTLYFEFQKELCAKIEQGENLNTDIINETFLKLLQEYYSHMILDEEIKYLWQTRMHLFYGIYRFYNFQYATGKVAALIINKNIEEGKLQDYLKFLTIGGSKPSLEALSIAGVDLTNKEVFDNAILYLNKLLDEYESLIKNN